MQLIINQSNGINCYLLLAHGAGAPMDSDFMNLMAAHLLKQGVGVVRFEFPYMQERRQTGKKRPPNVMHVLIDSYVQAIGEFMLSTERNSALPIFIGGKSMGGRVASMLSGSILDAESKKTDAKVMAYIKAVICLGYPFHPPTNKKKLRVDHLKSIDLPVYIYQGTRDKLGLPEEVASYQLPGQVHINWLDTGDHDLKPLKKSGFSQDDILSQVASSIAKVTSVYY